MPFPLQVLYIWTQIWALILTLASTPATQGVYFVPQKNCLESFELCWDTLMRSTLTAYLTCTQP